MSCEIEAQLLDIFSEILDLKGDEARLSTIENTPNWDSFNGLNLVLKTEETFSISLSMNDLNKCRSYKSILMVVRKKLDDRSG